MQPHYNLVYREEEREVLPLCAREGVGVIPFSPLMRGYLARPDSEMESTTRGQADSDRRDRWSPDSPATGEIKARTEELAAEKGVSVAQIALAWLFHKPVVDAPILGVTSVEHLEDAVEALDVSLSDSDMAYLEEPYEPVEIIGHE
jgi:aryl-alcohol dehydrogenase-like predicted oxidoreductase